MPSPTSVSPARRIKKRERCIYTSRNLLVMAESRLKSKLLMNQKRKLEEYAAEGIQEKKNLLITKEHFTTDSHDPEKKRACIDLREIVLQLISFGKIAPQKAFHLLFPDKPIPKI